MYSLKLHFNTAIKTVFVFLFCFFYSANVIVACTTVSAIDCKGHVWTANNEDGPFGVANFINVFPRSGTDSYGYYTMSYLSPRYGQGGTIQGGMNEAGLSFDFNEIPYVENFDEKRKKAYPEGNDAILPFILENMASVQEVVAFFDTYWFIDGFRNAQMHVSDKNGRFAIISASGTTMVKKGEFLVSTNFDISGQEDGSNCWRYPIAVEMLTNMDNGLSTMESICKKTAQKNGSTMYSNIQNLSTGDIWFFSKHDPGTILQTNLSEMLSKGQTSYTFGDLKSLKEDRPTRDWKAPKPMEVTRDIPKGYLGSYENSYIGAVTVKSAENGIEVSFADGTKDIFYAGQENLFYLADYDLYIKFESDDNLKNAKLSLYENGLWSFSAHKVAVPR